MMDPTLIPSIVNGLRSLLVGMVLWGVRAINGNLTTMNGRLSNHIENKDLHYAAQARTDEQIKTLTQAVHTAHTRIDRVEEKA